MRTKHVIVVPYDPKWAQDFETLERRIRAALGELAVGIEHVGSTSVPGLPAKPIVDIDAVIGSMADLPDAVSALAGAGWRWEGDLGIPGREAFAYEGDEKLPAHHLYVCPADSAELRRHRAFRDWLRAHPRDALEYGRIKREGAALFLQDIDGYIAHKAPFIEGIYRKAGAL